MRNIALLIAYDGTDFIGSQWQQQGRSVQGAIEAAWEQLSQEQCRVTFAGRTDAGVHAEGQVVHVSTATRHAPETIRRALNAYLPNDVAVLDVVEVEARFHARYSAISREYRYLIDNSAVAAPLLRHCSLHVSYPLDVGAMHFSLRGLVGRHDFASFTTAAARQANTVRTVHRVGCSTVEFCGRELIAIEIEANAFLYNMVRAIVGTVLEVGTGQRTSAAFAEILERRDRQAAGKTAPPHGLSLVRVGYPPEQLRWGGTR